MMPPVRPAGGRVRPAWRRARCARGALQHRHDDVGDALLVDAARARLRRRGRARRRPRQMESRRPAARNRRSRRGYPPATFRAAPRAGLFVDAATVKAAIGRRDTVTVNALGAAVPSRAGAQPLRPARPRARQRQRAGGHAGRSRDQGLHPARRRGGEVRRPGRDEGQARRSAIAAAASRPRSTCSCCTSSATTTSRSTTARWASGRRRSRCRSRRTERSRRRRPRARGRGMRCSALIAAICVSPSATDRKSKPAAMRADGAARAIAVRTAGTRLDPPVRKIVSTAAAPRPAAAMQSLAVS